ncbi:MAG TPA: SHOCT domain-containing protein [Acidimicrobiia bacterium]
MTFWNIFWLMLWFFFLVVWFWLLITVFADIFRRDDHSGWAKAAWTIFIVILPVLGILIYLIARPKMTAQDMAMMEQHETEQKRMAGYSSADEIAKLNDLRASGAITAEEYETLKAKAM